MLRVDTFPAVPWPSGVNRVLLEEVNREWRKLKLRTESQSQSQSGSWATREVKHCENTARPPARQNASNIQSTKPKNNRAGDKRNVKALSEAGNFDSLDSGMGTQKQFGNDEIAKAAKRSKGKKHQTFHIPTKGRLSKYGKENFTDYPKTRRGPSKKNPPTSIVTQNLPNFAGEFAFVVENKKSNQNERKNDERPETSLIEERRLRRREWLKRHGADGLWAQCCHENCGKWRLLLEYEDPTEVPEKWYCHMNSDPDFAACEVEEEDIPDDVQRELIENKYHVGSIVWARLDGYPWWPAMVEDCPDLLQWCQLRGNSPIPTKYHVVFLDTKKPQRAWIPDKDLKAYRNNPRDAVVKKIKFRGVNFTRQIDAACAWADEALALPVSRRLEKFGWTAQVSRTGRNVPDKTRGKLGTEPGPSKKINEKPTEIRYNVGDVVWAHPKGFPRWPAMIDKCPTLRKHYKLPGTPRERMKYYVVYFDVDKLDVDWCSEQSLKRFSSDPQRKSFKGTKIGRKCRIGDFNRARNLAETAEKLSLRERLKRFGISARDRALRYRRGLTASQSSTDESSSVENEQIMREKSSFSTNDFGQLSDRESSPRNSPSSPLSSENSFDMSKLSITISEPRSSSSDEESDANRWNDTKNRASRASSQRLDAIMKDFYSSHRDLNRWKSPDRRAGGGFSDSVLDFRN